MKTRKCKGARRATGNGSRFCPKKSIADESQKLIANGSALSA